MLLSVVPNSPARTISIDYDVRAGPPPPDLLCPLMAGWRTIVLGRNSFGRPPGRPSGRTGAGSLHHARAGPPAKKMASKRGAAKRYAPFVRQYLRCYADFNYELNHVSYAQRREQMAGWSTAICETSGINIHYMRTGGNKPPLILLHGLTANGACWTALAHALEGEYDVIMPDARGHGKSSVPDYGYRYEDHANDLVGLIEALRLPPPILLGHSMGGMTAAVVASRKPKILRGLILADPTFLSPKVQRQVRDSDVADQHRRMLSMSLDKLVAEARARHPDRSGETLELLARSRLQTSMAAFDVLTPPNPDYEQLVSTIDVPSLLVFGDKGVLSSVVAEELQRLNRRFQVVRIRQAGHGIHFDQPERFAAAIKSFLGTIDAVIES